MIHPALEKDEYLVLAGRHHWVTMILPLSLFFMGILLCLVCIVSSWYLFPAHDFARGFLILAGLFIGIIFTHWLFIYSFAHGIPVWVITNKRLIICKFLPYVMHDVSFVSISELHEIDESKHGLMQNMFNYGEVKMDLAANPISVILKQVPRPDEFVNLLEYIHETPPEELEFSSATHNAGSK